RAFGAVTGFVVYGLLLALVWVRLSAVDIALTEAAIGSGMTGVLLMRAAFRMHAIERVSGQASRALQLGAALLCAAVTAGLAAVVLLPADPAPTLAPEVAANLHALGLGNPVTGVLLGFRAIDTFLEKVVVLLALVGVWSLAADRHWGGAPSLWRRPD